MPRRRQGHSTTQRLTSASEGNVLRANDLRATRWGTRFLRARVRMRRMTARSPRLEIVYCPQCRWLLRASWLAQELLTTFPTELAEVALVPGPSGTFEVHLDDSLLFSRAVAGRFPEPKEIKQRVRDVIAPGRSLGHSDTPSEAEAGTVDD